MTRVFQDSGVSQKMKYVFSVPRSVLEHAGTSVAMVVENLIIDPGESLEPLG